MFILFNGNSDHSTINCKNENLSLKEVFDAAARGYQTGLSWSENYMPEGPWRSSYSEKYQLIHNAWLVGFKQGLKEKR